MGFEIEVDDVWFSYHGDRPVLKGVSFEVDRGEFLAIIGRNGSGKSTLMRLLVGLLKPTKGRIIVRGMDTRSEKVSRIAKEVGFIFQNPDDQLFCRSVEEELAFALRNLGLGEGKVGEIVERTLRDFALQDVRDVYPRFLSRGDKQKVSVAAIAAMDPSILILDEPTTGQDHRDSRTIMELVKGLNDIGKTVILVTHDMRNVAAYAERVILLEDGRILADAPTRHIFANEELLRGCGLAPPQITELAQSCADMGIRPDIISVEEMEEELRRVLRIHAPIH
ncbi:MAG: ATP-binding cassette domain-containing protein [Candidatus Bathyarchaeia archaeon]